MIETYTNRDKFNRMTVCTGTNRDDLLERSERLTCRVPAKSRISWEEEEQRNE